MVSAVTGLPAIIIDRFKDLESKIDLSSRDKSFPISKLLDDSVSSKMYSNNMEEDSTSYKLETKQADFNKLAEKLRSVLGENNLSIEFTMDPDLNKMVMRVIDSKTQEVVQQFPPDVTLKIARIVASTMGNGNVADAKI